MALLQPYDSAYVGTGGVHRIFYELYGNPNGKAALFLHGGPGGSPSRKDAAYFDATVYRVILLHQRGCGRSLPPAELADNQTNFLLSDIEALRVRLAIVQWHVVLGGSWGSTLALLYAQAYPSRVASLILRGVFLFRQSELAAEDPKPGSLARAFYPEAAAEYLRFFEEDERSNIIDALYMKLTSKDKTVAVQTAKTVNTWYLRRRKLLFDAKSLEALEDEDWSLQHARIMIHYVKHGGFIREGQILEEDEIKKIKHLPCRIIHGRYDMVCPPITAYELHQALPLSELIIVPDAGHSAEEGGIRSEIIRACDEFGKLSFEDTPV